MKWYNKLYTGASITSKVWTKFKITYGKKYKGYYCIALSDHSELLLDIYPSQLLRNPLLNTEDVFVIGVASDKEEAYEVVRCIIEDVYVHTHGFDIKSYLKI